MIMLVIFHNVFYGLTPFNIRSSDIIWFLSWAFIDLYSISLRTRIELSSLFRTLRTVPYDPLPIISSGS